MQWGRKAVYGIWASGHAVDLQESQGSGERVWGCSMRDSGFWGVHDFRGAMHLGKIHR